MLNSVWREEVRSSACLLHSLCCLEVVCVKFLLEFEYHLLNISGAMSKQHYVTVVTLLLPLLLTPCGNLACTFCVFSSIIITDCLLLEEEKASGIEKISDTLIFLD